MSFSKNVTREKAAAVFGECNAVKFEHDGDWRFVSDPPSDDTVASVEEGLARVMAAVHPKFGHVAPPSLFGRTIRYNTSDQTVQFGSYGTFPVAKLEEVIAAITEPREAVGYVVDSPEAVKVLGAANLATVSEGAFLSVSDAGVTVTETAEDDLEYFPLDLAGLARCHESAKGVEIATGDEGTMHLIKGQIKIGCKEMDANSFAATLEVVLEELARRTASLPASESDLAAINGQLSGASVSDRHQILVKKCRNGMRARITKDTKQSSAEGELFHSENGTVYLLHNNTEWSGGRPNEGLGDYSRGWALSGSDYDSIEILP